MQKYKKLILEAKFQIFEVIIFHYLIVAYLSSSTYFENNKTMKY